MKSGRKKLWIGLIIFQVILGIGLVYFFFIYKPAADDSDMEKPAIDVSKSDYGTMNGSQASSPLPSLSPREQLEEPVQSAPNATLKAHVTRRGVGVKSKNKKPNLSKASTVEKSESKSKRKILPDTGKIVFVFKKRSPTKIFENGKLIYMRGKTKDFPDVITKDRGRKIKMTRHVGTHLYTFICSGYCDVKQKIRIYQKSERHISVVFVRKTRMGSGHRPPGGQRYRSGYRSPVHFGNKTKIRGKEI